MTAILSVGRDDSLMAVRSMVLQQAGYIVTEVQSDREALRRLRCAKFDLMLICHTVPEREQARLAAAVRLLQPGLQIVNIRSAVHHSSNENCVTVDSIAPALLTDLSRILSKRGSGRTL